MGWFKIKNEKLMTNQDRFLMAGWFLLSISYKGDMLGIAIYVLILIAGVLLFKNER